MQHLALPLLLQVLSQPHHHCKSSAVHLLSMSSSLDYWWLKGRGGNRNNRSISVNNVYNLPQNVALAGLSFFFLQFMTCRVIAWIHWYANTSCTNRCSARVVGGRVQSGLVPSDIVQIIGEERGGIDWDAAGAEGLVIILIHWHTVWQSLFLLDFLLSQFKMQM